MAQLSLSCVSDEGDIQMEEIGKTSKVDTRKLFNAIVGRIACTVVSAILQRIQGRASITLDRWIARWYARKAFEATARLDLPTFGAQRRLGVIGGAESVLWSSLHLTVGMFSTALQLGTQAAALANTLRGYEGEQLLTWATLATEAITLYRTMRRYRHERGKTGCDFSAGRLFHVGCQRGLCPQRIWITSRRRAGRRLLCRRNIGRNLLLGTLPIMLSLVSSFTFLCRI